MALYYLTCPGCSAEVTLFFRASKEAGQQHCPRCGVRMKRAPKPPSSQVMETLDNGIMARRVERLKDAEELHKDRARNDPKYKP